jgi:hypothetical protein
MIHWIMYLKWKNCLKKLMKKRNNYNFQTLTFKLAFSFRLALF